MNVQEAITGAGKAGTNVLNTQRRFERGVLETLLRNFQTLKRSLENRLLSGLTDFKRFTTQALLADVDRLIAETEAAIQTAAARDLQTAAQNGQAGVDEPLKAAGAIVTPALPGVDADLVAASFGNTVDLLTVPMKQFGADVKAGLRRVTLAGDNKFEEIQRLRDKISGQGFDNAQYRAERIIRTEVGRVFNQAQYDRMIDLAKTFPFLRKGWRSTKDTRTRLGHREAGQTYARGQGIPVADLFSVNVYDERPGKGGKKTGTATMRFPLDPNTQPSGQIAASATIMCRCNGFVDFSPAELAQFNRQRVSQALGVPVAPPPTPTPPPAPVAVTPPPAPKPKPKPRPKPVPKPIPVPAPPAPTPAPAPVPATGGPTGQPISTKVVIPAGPGPKGSSHDDMGRPVARLQGAYDLARKALAIIDTIHGDGDMMNLPFVVKKGTFYGCYLRGNYMALSPVGTVSHPLMTVFHETGHYLDSMGLLKGNQTAQFSLAPTLVRVRGTRGRRGGWTTQMKPRMVPPGNPPPGAASMLSLTTEDRRVVSPELDALKDALRNSQAFKDLQTSSNALSYRAKTDMLSTKEVFARAYAQYIVVKSGNAQALAELDHFRSDMAAGRHLKGRQWEDDDFKPIVEAFDNLFRAVGWMK